MTSIELKPNYFQIIFLDVWIVRLFIYIFVKQLKQTTMTTLETKMIADIESMKGRSTRKECLEYDKSTLRSIINQGYVTVIGDRISREFHRRLQA